MKEYLGSSLNLLIKSTRSVVTKVHLLNHLVQNVSKYGPLKFFSCFIFESLNHIFNEKVHGNYKYEESATKQLILSQNIEVLMNKMDKNGDTFKFLKEKNQSKNLRKVEENLYLVGKGKI
jgi:hypothetical protein